MNKVSLVECLVLVCLVSLHHKCHAETPTTERPKICPYKECDCFTTYISCAWLRTTEVPHMIPSPDVGTYTNFIMDHNYISTLGNSSLPPNITNMDISSNFRNDSVDLLNFLSPLQETLTELRIGDNELTVIPDFSNFTYLRTAFMSINRFSNSSEGYFPPSLISLHLSDNNLVSVPKFVSSLANLTYFKISLNRLSKIEADDFLGNTGLNSLDLSNNPLTLVHPDAFKSLQHLFDLDLSATMITRLPVTLKWLSNLGILVIKDCPSLVCTCVEASALLPWFNSVYSEDSVVYYGKCEDLEFATFLSVLAQQCP